MLLKAGVSIDRLERNTRRGLGKVGDVFAAHSQEMVITSTYEGTHSDASLHYANRAFDVRFPVHSTQTIIRGIRTALGNRFDVVVEKTHYHIEYDPKE